MDTILQQQLLNVHCVYRENKAAPLNKPVTAQSGCGGRRPAKVSHVANPVHVSETRHTDWERRQHGWPCQWWRAPPVTHQYPTAYEDHILHLPSPSLTKTCSPQPGAIKQETTGATVWTSIDYMFKGPESSPPSSLGVIFSVGGTGWVMSCMSVHQSEFCNIWIKNSNHIILLHVFCFSPRPPNLQTSKDVYM